MKAKKIRQKGEPEAEGDEGFKSRLGAKQSQFSKSISTVWSEIKVKQNKTKQKTNSRKSNRWIKEMKAKERKYLPWLYTQSKNYEFQRKRKREKEIEEEREDLWKLERERERDCCVCVFLSGERTRRVLIEFKFELKWMWAVGLKSEGAVVSNGYKLFFFFGALLAYHLYIYFELFGKRGDPMGY